MSVLHPEGSAGGVSAGTRTGPIIASQSYVTDFSAAKSTAVILTALEVETRAILRHLWECKEEVVGGTVFVLGYFGGWNIAVAEVGAGNSGAAAIAERAVQKFRPSVALFVGIAGGIKDVSIGDVVIATKMYGYESGKETDGGFGPRPDVQTSSHALEQRGRAIRLKDDWKKRLNSTLSHKNPRIFVGPIAAGEKVVATTRGATAQMLRHNYGDALAVEMEGRGFLGGVQLNAEVQGCVIRGVSDVLDKKEDADANGSQDRAADAASAVAMELLFALGSGATGEGKPTIKASPSAELQGQALERPVNSTEQTAKQDSTRHVVLLVHGIRDFARWQDEIRTSLEREELKVELTNYGRVNLLEFILPIPYFRRRAAAELLRQIYMVLDSNPGALVSVIAHSFGTLALSHVIRDNFNIRFHRVIFCGSVVPYNFKFEEFRDRFQEPIINEVGTRDPWPAIAESITVGYGSAGTYGFRRPLIRDRWHNRAHHGFFLNAKFCETYWIPFLQSGTIVKAAESSERPRVLLQLISIFKIKYVLLALAFAYAAYILARNAGSWTIMTPRSEYMQMNDWVKADSRGVRVLRAFGVQVSLAKAASRSAKNGTDRQMLAIRNGALTSQILRAYRCAFVSSSADSGKNCLLYDDTMSSYYSGLSDLAVSALPIDKPKTLASKHDRQGDKFLQLMDALLMTENAAEDGEVHSIYRDMIELETQLWLTSPEIDDRAAPYRIGYEHVAILRGIYERGNEGRPALLAAISALRGQGLSPLPQAKVFLQQGEIMTAVCGQITADAMALQVCRRGLQKSLDDRK